MAASLTRDEAYEYLDSRPGWMVLTTIGRDGFPHSIPLGYFRAGDDICIAGRAGSQRVVNAQRNPRVSLLLESGGTMKDIKGLVIQGEAEVVTEGPAALELAREAARSRGTAEDELPSEVRPGTAYIRVRPRKFISWDYSREG